MANNTSSSFLDADHIAVLDTIDFQWNVSGDTYRQNIFHALMNYEEDYGDGRVPCLYIKNPKLGEWVMDQHHQWKLKSEGRPNLMTEERKTKLDGVGFVWKVWDWGDWNDRY